MDKPRFTGLRWPDSTRVVVFSQGLVVEVRRSRIGPLAFASAWVMCGWSSSNMGTAASAVAPTQQGASLMRCGCPRPTPSTVLFCQGRIFRCFALAG